MQELHSSDFGKREEIHKIKRAKRAADLRETQGESGGGGASGITL